MTARVLALMTVITFVLALMAPVQLAVYCILLCLGILVFSRPPARSLAPRPGMALATGGVFLWAALSALWSLHPEESLMRFLQLTALLIIGTVILRRVQAVTGQERALLPMASFLTVSMSGLFILSLSFFPNQATDLLHCCKPTAPGEVPEDAFRRFDAFIGVLAFPVLLTTSRIRNMPQPDP